MAIGYLTHSAMTFILKHVNQNVDTFCVMLLLFHIINFKKSGREAIGEESSENQAWTQAVGERIGYIQNCLLKCNS